jgi:Zn-dependent protease
MQRGFHLIMIDIAGFIISFGFLIVAMVFHEVAHGWVAYLRGDSTARYSGRLTLNPLAHIDPIGTIVVPLLLFISTQGRFVFGSAKPVPVDFSRLRNPKTDMMLVGAAGPAANLVLATVSAVLWRFLPDFPASNFIFQSMIMTNVVLALFNLFPIPPLDGSRIVMGFLPRDLAYQYAKIEPYGFFIIMALLWLNVLDLFLWPAVNVVINVIYLIKVL